MKKAFTWLSALLVAISIGTSVSLVLLLIMLWWKGVLADERVLGMLAALQGIKPASLTAEATLSTDSERSSPNEIQQARLRASLDLDLRESAIDKTLCDLRTIETQLRTESTRLDDWKKSFDKRLSDLQTAATDASLAEVQRTLEVIAPKQAKDQIMRMLNQPPVTGENPMQDIITILKQMPLDKRKKILEQFKSDEEIEKLHEIFREILRGGADADLLRDTRTQLQQQGNP